MGYYYPGYSKAHASIEHMTLDELLAVLDTLFGRGQLKYGAGIEDVREEAYRQMKEEWTDKSSPEYERAKDLERVYTPYKENRYR